jgi:hypothetical protein
VVACEKTETYHAHRPPRLRHTLSEVNPDALLLGTADRDGNPVSAYSREGIITCLITSGMDPEDAEEWCSYNIEGSYMGEHAPIIVSTSF